MIEPEKAASILRLSQVEHWPVGTIARELGVHHETVERVLRDANVAKATVTRPSRVDPYVPFITETWGRHPRLCASRLYHMCVARGYVGSPSHFRAVVARLRPRPPAEAYLRLRTLPGEQAQVDWGHFGHLEVGRARRPLMAFVMVLSYSRAIYLRFTLSQSTEAFLVGHQGAFAHFGGCARSVLYDNLKSAVIERTGSALRFNPVLLAFANHHRFEPRPVAVARGNEKGRVERAIRYARTSFFPARVFRDLADLNAQAMAWCAGLTMDRRWPQDTELTVRQAYEAERGSLLPLPAAPFPVEECQEVVAGKSPYVRFDLNDYSVPHTRVSRTLCVRATQETVRVLDGTEVVAHHPRSYDRHQVIEDAAHVAGLVAEKRRARAHRGVDALSRAAPSSVALLERAAARGESLGRVTSALLDLLGEYGGEALEAALAEVLKGDAAHAHAVAQVLERNHAARGLAPAQALPVPTDPRYRDLVVKPQPLEKYDELARRERVGAPDHEGGAGDDRTATDG